MVKILVEFTVELHELEQSRKEFHEGLPLSLATIFEDDLQQNAYEDGVLYGDFIVISATPFD